MISATHGVINKHADNCINASASASTNTVKNTSASSAIFKQNNVGIHSARAKAGAARTIAKARRRPVVLGAATAPTLPALPLPQGGWQAKTSATATATTTKKRAKAGAGTTIAKARRRPAAHGPRLRPARLAVAMGTTARKNVGDGDNKEDKDGDEDGDGNEDEVVTKTTMRRQRGKQQQRQ